MTPDILQEEKRKNEPHSDDGYYFGEIAYTLQKFP
jgi:hypothetical protein